MPLKNKQGSIISELAYYLKVNTVVSNSIKISRNFKLLYIRNGFQIRIPRPEYACAENFKYIRQRERPL